MIIAAADLTKHTEMNNADVVVKNSVRQLRQLASHLVWIMNNAQATGS